MMLLLKSIRRIVRASDLGSRSLQRSAGLTTPQLAVMTAIGTLGEVSTTRIARDVDLSAATVVTIIDNLERRGLVTRHRSSDDRRIVHLRLSDEASAILLRAQGPFGEAFSARFAALPVQRRLDMLTSLAALADLMSLPDDAK